MKRILITTGIFHPDIGGPASYAAVLAEKLSEEGNKVAVLTYSDILKNNKDQASLFKIERVWRKLPGFLKHGIYFLKTLSLARKTDVIFSLNAVSSGIPAMIAAKITGKKFFVKIVGDYAWETATNSRKTNLMIDDFQRSDRKGWTGFLHKLQCRVCKRADAVIVPSQYLLELVAGWGIDKEKIKMVHNGVDFKPAGISKEEARKSIGIPGNIIMSAGRLVPWKGFRMLIKIMPKLLEINQFFRLVIIGSGPERKTLEMMIKNMNLDRKVYLISSNKRSELALYLAASDLFVLNSGYEGFSHQLLEVLSAGVPVIASTSGGNKELIEQGDNGFLVKYNDEYNLIEAIKGLSQLPELQEQFIKEGRETAKKFTTDRMFRETIKILST